MADRVRAADLFYSPKPAAEQAPAHDWYELPGGGWCKRTSRQEGIIFEKRREPVAVGPAGVFYGSRRK